MGIEYCGDFIKDFIRFDEKGRIHRTDGPACIRENGEARWYVNGYRLLEIEIDDWLNENDIKKPTNIEDPWLNAEQIFQFELTFVYNDYKSTYNMRI
jgi:hypothetical protein